ncbi:hypothetical protein nbrc107696_01130 [Gordonia spumicola]|uniref:Transmembrane protein n=1 Tax=Gordonia spumicola TaxID=589161 RepID=A0A7I9V375_9ACTN|nr:hypothetical protein nbrc107696_01130 [Gordonia spumicola]
MELWGAVVLAELITMIARYPIAFDTSQKYLEEMRKNGEDVPVSATALAVAVTAFSIVLLAVVSAVVVKFVWDGRNWARQVLGVFGAFLVVQLFFAVIALFITSDSDGGATVPAWAMVFEIIGGVAAIGVLVALMHRDTAVYCRDVAAWRTRNRQNGRDRQNGGAR